MTLQPLHLLGAGLTAFLIAWWISRSGRLDDPQEQRRLHTVATPRGGGLGIALVALGGMYFLPIGQALGGGAALLLVSAAGAIEDRIGLAARWRLLLHLVAAVILVQVCLPQAHPLLKFGLVIGVAGWINLVNFMDGANGLIGLQALLAGLAWWLFDPLSPLAPLALILAAASAGFLPLNFPRARVFLGDAGSYSIGLLSAWLWLYAAEREPWQGTLCGLLGALPILVDAGLTLSSRFFRGRQWYSAHREHLYQWYIRRGSSHVSISLGYLLAAVLTSLLAWWVPTEHLLTAVLVASAGLTLTWWVIRGRLHDRYRASDVVRARVRNRVRGRARPQQ